MNQAAMKLLVALTAIGAFSANNAHASPTTSIVLGADPENCGPVPHPGRTDPYVEVYLPCQGKRPPADPQPRPPQRKSGECSFAVVGMLNEISVVRGDTFLRSFDSHRDAHKFMRELVDGGICRQARPKRSCSVTLNNTPWAHPEANFIVKVGTSPLYAFPADRGLGRARANAAAIMGELVRDGVCLAPGTSLKDKRAEILSEGEEAAAL